jgi:hypothetical protein
MARLPSAFLTLVEIRTSSWKIVTVPTSRREKPITRRVASSRDLVHWTKHGLAFGRAAGGRFADLMPIFFKNAAQQSSDRCFIVNDQDRVHLPPLKNSVVLAARSLISFSDLLIELLFFHNI